MDTDQKSIAGPNRRGARLADGAVGVAFLALGLYMTGASVTQYQAFSQGQVGPGVLPFLIGLTMVLTSGLVLAKLRRTVAYEQEMPTGTEFVRVLGLLVLMIACVALIPIVGAIATLGVFIFVETAFLERRTWLVSLAASLGIPILLYFFFEVLLGVPLPAGALGLV